MYFDVGISEGFTPPEDSEYTGFCVTHRMDSGSTSAPVFAFPTTAKRLYKKVEVDVRAQDVTTMQLNRLTGHEVLAIKVSDENTLKYACDKWDVDIITLDFSTAAFPVKDGWIRNAINRNVFFEIELRKALYGSKERVTWLKNVHNLLRITRGRNTVISSGATCSTEVKSVWDIYKFLRFLGLSHRRAQMVMHENASRLLRACALKRYAFKGCVANDLDEGNLKFDFILKDFGC